MHVDNRPISQRLFRLALTPFLGLSGLWARRRLRHWLEPRAVAAATPGPRPRYCFVTTWYGPDQGSGAESECYRLVHSLKETADVEVATTTLRGFSFDWNVPAHPAGTREIEGVRVHRFHPESRQRLLYRVVNRLLLMKPGPARLGALGECFYLDQMIWSRGLLEFLERERENFDSFFYIPYLLSSSILGINQTGRRSVLIPCLHEESYATLTVVKQAFQRAGRVLFHAEAERALAERLYAIPTRPEQVVGEQVSALHGDAQRFRQSQRLSGPFLLYVGRKLPGKRLPQLVESFSRYRRARGSGIELVIIGSGELSYRGVEGVRDLGFVSEQDKVDAMAAATALCQPSLLESFSLVLMEAWIQGTPSLIARGSEVTAEHGEKSGGAILYGNDAEFAAAVDRLLDASVRNEMGMRGKAYVEDHFSSATVLEKLRRALSVPPAG